MTLGERMKSYEAVSKNFLTNQIPAIIRIDGKAFHTFTRGMKKPFDDILIKTMQTTMKDLCENIQGAVFGYTQSDEITIVLNCKNPENSHHWFDGGVQKIVSVAASLATLYFNKNFKEIDTENKYENKYDKALFDARVFNITKDEIINNLIWRQEDASKNSIQMLARSLFSHKQLQGLNGKELQNKMLTEKDVNWNDLHIIKKRGTSCYKVLTTIHTEFNGDVDRMKWTMDKEIPIIKNDREYITNIFK